MTKGTEERGDGGTEGHKEGGNLGIRLKVEMTKGTGEQGDGETDNAEWGRRNSEIEKKI